MTIWYRCEGDTITLSLHIQPGAKHSEVVGLHGDALKIRLAAPPLEGRANDALRRFIADRFEVTLRQVELLRGGQSRHKMIKISGSKVDPETLFPAGALPRSIDV
jgi:uncharacterized protein (TIGR00251 family)